MKSIKKALAFLLSLVMVIGVFANTGLEISAATNNTITVYYNNNWSQANIHYQKADGLWTDVPGEKMATSSEKSGYKWKATINIGSRTETQVCFNNGDGVWDSKNGQNYRLNVGTFGIKDGSVEKFEEDREITCDFTMDKTKVLKGDTVNFTGSASNLSFHRYNTYKYTIKNSEYGVEKEIYCGMSCMDASYTFDQYGEYEITFYVNEYTTHKSATVTKKINVTSGMEITSFTTDLASPQQVGTTINLNVDVKDEALYRYNTHDFYVIKDGKETKLNVAWNAGYSISWTPTEAGNYTLKYYVRDYSGAEATKTISYTVTDGAEKYANVYYYNKEYTKANIHFRTGKGAWTSVPGMQMAASSEKAGYTWKYSIPLGNETVAEVCFNNGNGNWDSKNGANYFVYEGDYGVKDGVVTKLTNVDPEITCDFTMDNSKVLKGSTVNFKGSASNLSYHRYNTYTYTIKDLSTGSKEVVNCGMSNMDASYTFNSCGEYEITFYVEEYTTHNSATVTKKINVTAGLEVTSLKASVASPQKVGTAIELKATIENEATFQGSTRRFTVKKANGSEETLNNFMQTNVTWTPSEAGDYVITFYVKDSTGAEASKSINYTVTDNKVSNTLTIYYANDNFSKANIHFKVGSGAWTSVPGVAMTATTEKSGYSWKCVIDLGTATTADVCFNNGNNVWDSKNGSNYKFTAAGTYGVKGGVIYSLK